MVETANALCGVKVAMRPVAESRVTDDATTGVEPGAGPTTANVAVFTVNGSIRSPDGTLNVALMEAPGHTLVAFADGLVDCTETLAVGPGADAVNVQT